MSYTARSVHRPRTSPNNPRAPGRPLPAPDRRPRQRPVPRPPALPSQRPNPGKDAPAKRRVRGGIGGALGTIEAIATIYSQPGSEPDAPPGLPGGAIRRGMVFQNGKWRVEGYKALNPYPATGPTTVSSRGSWVDVEGNRTAPTGYYLYEDSYVLYIPSAQQDGRLWPLSFVVPRWTLDRTVPAYRPAHWPMDDPFGAPAPTPMPGEKPMFRPQRLPRISSDPAWSPAISVGPRGGIKKITVSNFRPPKGTKERKGKFKKGSLASFAFAAWSMRESGMDLIDDLYKAADGQDGASLREKLAFLFLGGGLDKVTVESWLEARQERIAEDRIFGYLDQLRGWAAEALDRPISIGIPDIPLPSWK